IGGTLRADSDGTIDLNGVFGYSVPTTLFIGGGTPGNLARTGGGTFAVTNFQVRGGSVISTAVGDSASNLVEVTQGSSLSLLGDIAPANVDVLDGSTLNIAPGLTVTTGDVDLGELTNPDVSTIHLGT